jgi:hypothetical protein
MKRKTHKLRLAAAALLLALAAGGCSTQFGSTITNHRFVYPNSNVRVLGPVKATVSRTGFISATLPLNQVKETYEAALAQQSGANLLVNIKEDTTTTLIPIIPIVTITYTIEGDAAVMEIGKQVLK